MTLVSGRDDTPEGAGIFRVFGDRDVGPPPSSPAPEAVADKPVPAQAPKAGKTHARTTAKSAAKNATKTTAKTGTIAEAPTQAISLAGSTGAMLSAR